MAVTQPLQYSHTHGRAFHNDIATTAFIQKEFEPNNWKENIEGTNTSNSRGRCRAAPASARARDFSIQVILQIYAVDDILGAISDRDDELLPVGAYKSSNII